jgi:photosystem II stability/assembly factor-like uncharacterized protein
MQVRSDQPIEYLDQMTWDRVEFHPFAIGGSEGIVSLYEATENWGHTILEYRSPIEVNRWKAAILAKGWLLAKTDQHTSWRCMNEHWPPAPPIRATTVPPSGRNNPQWRAFER